MSTHNICFRREIQLDYQICLSGAWMIMQNGNPNMSLLQSVDLQTSSVILFFKTTGITPDKRWYPHNIFLISPQKHLLWVLIRSASLRHF